jgi:hypothetical protein
LLLACTIDACSALPYTFIVVAISECRIYSFCVPIGAPAVVQP